MPRADNATPPSDETVAPRVAEEVEIDETVGEERVGAVAEAVDVTDKLSIPILGLLPDDPPDPLW